MFSLRGRFVNYVHECKGLNYSLPPVQHMEDWAADSAIVARYVRFLIGAAQRGDKATVTRVLASGLSINSADDSGATPLHHAAIESQPEMLAHLLKLGASARAVDNHGRAALQCLLQSDDYGRGPKSDDMFRQLVLHSDSDVQATDHQGVSVAQLLKDRKFLADRRFQSTLQFLRWYHPFVKKNTLALGFWVIYGGLHAYGIFSLGYRYDFDKGIVSLNTLALWALVTGFLQVATRVKDPGFLPVQVRHRDDQSGGTGTTKEMLASGWSLCIRCGVYRPPRTRHCYTCHACVEHKDHHCDWTGSCVARGNALPFVLFLCSLIGSLTTTGVVLCQFLWEHYHQLVRSECISASLMLVVVVACVTHWSRFLVTLHQNWAHNRLTVEALKKMALHQPATVSQAIFNLAGKLGLVRDIAAPTWCFDADPSKASTTMTSVWTTGVDP